MNHRLLRLLATVLTMALSIPGLTGPLRTTSPPFDPCDPNDGVSIGDFIMWESVDGGSAVLPISAKAPCLVARTITYRTFDITAKAGEDYVGVSFGSFVIPAGKVRTTLTIQVLGDTIVEPTETFGVQLLDGAKFDDPQGIVTIRDH
jgi:hypothetical protein